MNILRAIQAAKAGAKVRREGWKDEGDDDLALFYDEDCTVDYLCFSLYFNDKSHPYYFFLEDIEADDWEIVT